MSDYDTNRKAETEKDYYSMYRYRLAKMMQIELRPKALYVGRLTFTELKRTHEAIRTLQYEQHGRYTFAGVPVIQVDLDYHFELLPEIG